MTIIPVILAGGSGSRLWPLSRQQYPKQFLKLFGDHTMLQQTLLRLKGLNDVADPIVICNEDHRFTVAEQLQTIGVDGDIILEPVAKNTAPAIALAALRAEELSADAVLLVLPADHLIQDIPKFHSAINQAAASALSGLLATFGIVPTRPETGYGYIQLVESLGPTGNLEKISPSAKKVSAFVEKPDLPTAQEYLQAGNYLWNSGMFVFRARAYLDELRQYEQACVRAAEKAHAAKVSDLDFIRIDKTSFAQAPNISIDYAVMEKSSKVVCVPLNANWSDVGCWKSYWDTNKKDDNGNVYIGDVLSENTTDTLVYAQNKLVSIVGVKDLIVVDTADAVLVAHKDAAQNVKNISEQLNDANRNESVSHRKVNRPWGSYDSVDCGDRFQVKRIEVKPGASLSLQMHHHRAEHWIVVKGTAKVQRGEEEIVLSENESTFIPLGIKHRLSNPGKMPLELIEVQSGSYLGEDDIVRFDDTYGRS